MASPNNSHHDSDPFSPQKIVDPVNLVDPQHLDADAVDDDGASCTLLESNNNNSDASKEEEKERTRELGIWAARGILLLVAAVWGTNFAVRSLLFVLCIIIVGKEK